MRNINQLKEKIKNSKGVTLPPALAKLKFNRLMAGVIVLIACVIASIGFKNISFLVGAIVAAYMIFIGLKVNYDYANDSINEYKLTCVSASMSRNGVDIVFCDEDNNTDVFNYPVKKDVFFENVNYTIYTHKQNNKVIIAFLQN